MTKVKKKLAGFLTVALVAFLSLGILSGCSGGKNDEKVLTIAFPSTITTLDISDGDAATMLKEVGGVVETLVNVDSNFNLMPSLAVSWERVSETAWVFNLREGVTFHDGSDFNADAVKWCFDRQIAEDKSFSSYTKITSVDVLDTYKVQLNTSAPTGEVPEALTNVAACIIAKSSVDDQGQFVKPVGTGYFQYEDFDVSTGNSKFVTFDDYWNGKPDSSITERDILSMPDSSTRSLAVQNGEVDIATDVPFSDLATLKDNKEVKVEQFNTARTYFNTFNTKKDYLSNVEVRRGLLCAIDYDEMVNGALLGVGSVPNGIFMEDVPWNNPDVASYSYNAEKAKELFDSAGFVDSDGDGMREYKGEEVKLNIVTGSRRPGNALIAQAMQGYFASVGVDAEVNVLEGTALSSAQSEGTYDLYISSAATGYVPSASYYLSQYYESTSKNAQYAGYSNGKLDTLIDQCRGLISSEEKYEVSRQAQVLAQDDAVVTTLANYGAVFAMNPKITGFSYSAAVHDFIVPYTVDIEG